MTQTTINLSNSVRTQYIDKYHEGVKEVRTYDMFAQPIGKDMSSLEKGSSVTVPYLSKMTPREQTISEETDITTQALRDATASISWDSRADGLKYSELVKFQTYTDYAASAYKEVGENMMQTVELIAQHKALTGTSIQRAVARASLDAGTAGHLASESLLMKIATILGQLRVSTFVNANGFQQWFAVMPMEAYHDLRTSGNVIEVSKYQQGQNILKWELASLGPFKLMGSPFAKTFGAAGADNATSVATTLNGAVNALSRTIVTAGDVSANIAAGRVWWIGTEETGDTHHSTNEPVTIASEDGTTLTITGGAENGGLLYDHPTGTSVRNADSVYPILFGGPESMAKIYYTETGEYGQALDPEIVGKAKQWVEIVWKFYGNYGILSQNKLWRAEVASSMDA